MYKVIPYVHDGLRKIRFEHMMQGLTNHDNVRKLLGEIKWIPKQHYRYMKLKMDQVIEYSEAYHVADKILNYSDLYTIDIFKVMAKALRCEDRIDKDMTGVIAVLALEEEEAFCSFKECKKEMMKQFDWVFTLIEFVETLTRKHILLIDECYEMSIEKWEDSINPMDYFVFNKKGEIKYFIGFNTIRILEEWYLPHGFEFVVENNIRVMKGWIENLYNYMISEVSKGVHYEKDMKIFNGSILTKLEESMGNVSSLKDLKDLKEALKQNDYFANEMKQDDGLHKKIGIFMDTANIYKPLRYMDIDFYKLWTCIYGNENIKHIGSKYCTLYIPTYTDLARQAKVEKEKSIERRNLEKYGFKVEEVRNGKSIADQADDLVLQEFLSSHIHEFYEVLVLTGDGHFLEFFRNYRDYGVKVKILSLNENTTSNRIINEFKEDVHYIDEYAEAINLVNKERDKGYA